MKKKSFKTLALIPFLAVISSFLSFSSPKGGEGFEVYLNNQILSQKFGKHLNEAVTVDLVKASENDELKIRYYQCGGIGKERRITIKDAHDITLKVWNVANSGNREAFMSVKVKDILGLPKSGNSELKLYYSSSELPSGRLLASLQRSR